MEYLYNILYSIPHVSWEHPIAEMIIASAISFIVIFSLLAQLSTKENSNDSLE